MYLSRLDMVGFKSFAHKTELTFTDGVTSIVGPNGCGKSNIVDAIRWVLGEQKTSALRADSMEQVIFNGSRTRKPLGLAEVSLTIENNKQILPTEYSQVVITRRLFRNGESQYLLNKTQCRLRDIIDLFMDTGMGADAYSVIELKMIETILSDKADERRHLFEEAAGVTKYKARRKEAFRKLEAAQRDIARVQDIVREVQKTVNSLARQAEKARQHQELSTRLRELDRLLFAFEYAEEYLMLKQWEASVAQARAAREAAEHALAQGEVLVAACEQAHLAKEQELRAALDNESNVRAAAGDMQQQVSLADERIASARRALDRLNAEHTESATRRMTMEEELGALQGRLKQLDTDIAGARSSAEGQKQKLSEASTVLNTARTEMAERREALAHARQALAEERAQAERLGAQIEALQRRLRENALQQTQAEDRRSQVEEQIGREVAELPALDAALAEAEQRQHAGEERERTLRAEQESLQTESDDVRSAVAHSRASLEFLIGLVDTTESSKFLMTSPEWTPSGEKVTLAEVINTDEDLRVAIEAALGEAARYFVVADRAEADQAIRALSSNNVGKATFLCRDAVPAMEAPPALPAIAGVQGWASELVRTDDGLRGAVRGILGRTVIVDDLASAWKAVAETTADAAVTRTGEIVHRAGAVRGGSASKTEGVRVGRRERIDRLTADVEQLEQRLSTIETRIREIKQELGTIDLRRLADDVRRAALLRNDRQQRVDALRGRRDDIDGQRDVLHSEAATFTAELADMTHRVTQAEAQLASAAEGIVRLDADVASAQQRLESAEATHAEYTGASRAAEIDLVRLLGEQQTLQSDIQRLSSQSMDIEQRREQRERERDELSRQIDALGVERERLTADVARLSAALADARAARESLELGVREAQSAFHDAGEAVRAQRRVTDAALEGMHDADLRFNEIRLRIEALQRRAVEELAIAVPDEPSVPESELTPDAVRTDVQELRRKLTTMGNVNFLALEEHERESERLAFLHQQLTDLTNSERTLQETIAEINQTAREKFAGTFERIRVNFIDLFKVLFTEDDEADLQMIDDGDPLECKIEIVAKPRGKRPHNIEMLSGGEKTLTAIALLFAIYLVKPSPFCILDEVDAPLDDANIDRYLKIIRKFAENTQFLMITHNKKTMEAADTLYGVTMEEPAVSKVVSVRLAGDAARTPSNN
ncbi:MAG: chromosome segregation protein SMC [Candidatus Kapabacteria bacterium]|nr:chromosome segregation protein SMC [Candidatus Kapabacteria bacterium]